MTRMFGLSWADAIDAIDSKMPAADSFMALKCFRNIILPLSPLKDFVWAASRTNRWIEGRPQENDCLRISNVSLIQNKDVRKSVKSVRTHDATIRQIVTFFVRLFFREGNCPGVVNCHPKRTAAIWVLCGLECGRRETDCLHSPSARSTEAPVARACPM